MKAASISIAICALVMFAGATHAGAKCRYVKLATLSIVVDARIPVVEGAINGKPAKMLLDTGSWTTALTLPGVKRLGLTLAHKSGEAVGAGGASELYRAYVDTFAMGAVSGERGDYVVLSEVAADAPFDVVIGAESIFEHDVEVSLADRKVALFQPIDCGDSPLAYWDRDAPFVTLGRISSRDVRRVVTVKVNGGEVRALVDSGAARSVLDLAAAARLGVTPASPGVEKAGHAWGVGKHSIQSWVAPFASFEIGGERIDQLRLAISDLRAAAKADVAAPWFSRVIEDEPEMLLGADFLRAHRVLLAPSQNRMYFTYLGGPVFDSK